MPAQLGVGASRTVRLPNLLMDRADQNQRLRVGQSLALRRTTGPAKPESRSGSPTGHRTGRATGRICAASRSRHISQQLLREICRRFFVISSSISSRATWARNRDSSICSAPAGFSLPALAAFTQLRSVCSTSPSSSAVRAMLPTSSARLTACSLNSAVYSCSGMRLTSFFLSSRQSYDDYLGRRKSWGSSVCVPKKGGE